MSRSVALAARLWHASGVSAIPGVNDGTKRPGLSTWRDLYKSGRPTDGQLASWFPLDGNLPIYGLLCGNLSGGLEMFEFEGRAVTEGWMADFVRLLFDNGAGDLWKRLVDGPDAYVEETPSGGIHVLYRVTNDDGHPAASGNMELASRPTSAAEREAYLVATGKVAAKQLVMIETRGDGGFTVTAPSRSVYLPKPNATWNLDADGLGCWKIQTGTPGVVPTISAAERDRLYAIARMLDRMPVRPSRVQEIADRPLLPWEGAGTGTPLDDFEARTDWAEILEPHGWALVRSDSSGTRYWRRPGKDAMGYGGDRGHLHSASTGKAADRDRMYVWSTSTDLDANVPMTKGYVYAVLNHGGDLHGAAQDLKRMGFGRASDSTWADDLQGPAAGPAVDKAISPHQAPHQSIDESPMIEDFFDWCPAATPDTGPTAHTNVFVDTWMPDPSAAPIAPELAACYLPDEFWSARSVFGFLRAAAQARMESPEGALAAALAATLARVMPNVVLPACVGVEASLNLMTVAVGAAGDGKSACRKIVKEVLKFDGVEPVWEFPPSSGQGIAGQYQALRKPKGGEPYMEPIRWSALAIVEESDRIAALAAQVSNTLSSELRAAAMGELIGSGNVGDTKTNMPEGTYRFVLAMCMQPELSGWLLDEKSGGLPQRFLWTCIRDPRVIEGILSPGTWSVKLPFEATADPVSGAPRGHHVMGVTDKICSEIRAAKIARKRAIGGPAASDEYDGHITLLRLKVSGALALLDGRLDISDEDWQLAAHVVRTSKATIRYTQAVAAESNARKAEVSRKAKVADAKAIKVAEVQTTEEKVIGEVSKTIYEKIKRNASEGILKSEITTSFSSGRRDYVEPALDKLLAANLVHFEKVEYRGRNGSRWFLV